MTAPAGYVTLAEASARLGMDRATLARRIAGGLCPARWRRGRCFVPEVALATVPRPVPVGWRAMTPRARRAAVRRRQTA